ncbi:TIGR00730 family Rossman fold protein [Cyclobacterium jeungdonense]|uniref:Cytokinin riboside 5'-monophosphate phosphoribohydrolase n=1 Tax=Cyclobacterium jeungdonense TaxID=708087 RepID=A0ABT8C778_9BACT|nr:TIGR00730 family Rossman fold protein [Cyclobacterium jeungdonense]MDN3688624.1 TIGR00730 family Rossman fold protein [Cyclobacterium jeungdonense]
MIREEKKKIIPLVNPEEEAFLAGPQTRLKDFKFVLKVLFEFIRGFRMLHFVGPCVTVFGSARFEPSDYFYKEGVKVGQAISHLGFTVMTGGGPGIMEAANKGAKLVGGKSVGCNIVLPFEQFPNAYLDKYMDFNYFFVRKVLLSKYSFAFVVLPGGFGTLDEFFEALTLIQTRVMKRFPVVLMGKEFHQHLFDHIRSMAIEGTISEEDLGLFLLTDSVEEMENHLKKYAIEEFGLKRKGPVKPSKLLGESR